MESCVVRIDKHSIIDLIHTYIIYSYIYTYILYIHVHVPTFITQGTKYQEIILYVTTHIIYTYTYKLYIGLGYSSVFNCCAPFVDTNSPLRFTSNVRFSPV